MADLLTAAKTQVQYAINELKSGDKAKALEHMTKAAGFIERANAATAAVPEDEAAAKPLSADPSEAGPQILRALGFDPAATNSPGAILAAASPLQNQQLALLGFFGTPDDQATFLPADFSLYEQYHERIGGGSWAPKAGINAAWPEYHKTL